MFRRFRLVSCALFAGIILCGCRRSAPEVWPTHATFEPPYSPQESSSNAFDGYARAALMAQAEGGKDITRVSFTPGQRASVVKRMSKAMGVLRSSTRLNCDFQFRLRSPLDVAPYHEGWRLLSRAMVWQIEDQFQAGQSGQGIATFLATSKWGFDLTQGSALDASLGLTIVNEARRALAPHLKRLGAGELTSLIQGMGRVNGLRPDWKIMVQNEREMMLGAVQVVQSSLRSGEWTKVRESMGSDAREAIAYIVARKDKPEDRVPYFENWVKEIELEAQSLTQAFGQSTAKRELFPDFGDQTRPWRRFARHFCRTARPLVELNDLTTARTRLLIAEAFVLRQLKTQRRAPANLNSLAVALRTDPYRDQPLIYRTQGVDYKLYSVGANLRDDGGETDESGTTPDLVLENP